MVRTPCRPGGFRRVTPPGPWSAPRRAPGAAAALRPVCRNVRTHPVCGRPHQGDPVTKVSGSCTADWLPEGCLSREAFHPKSDGTTGYADVMKSRLTALGYTGS
ncbi:hypothetical protein GCM10010392_48760 [Streptomyces clavifer]|nr:hypothetical protein GCM10010392_48760 [Streptomyces clavifer]